MYVIENEQAENYVQNVHSKNQREAEVQTPMVNLLTILLDLSEKDINFDNKKRLDQVVRNGNRERILLTNPHVDL